MGRLRDLALFLLPPPLLGVLATFGFAPWDYYGLTLLAVAGLLALWWQETPGRSALQGLLFGLGLFVTGLYWVFISTHYHGGAPAAVSVFLVVALSVVLSLYLAFAGALSGAMRNLPRWLWALLLVPACWLLAELLRAYLFTGFPWFSLGYALTDAPVQAFIPLIGVHGLSALLVSAAGALVLLLRGGLSERALVLALLIALPLLVWFLPPGISWTQPVGSPVPVAIIQGNIPQDHKWQRDSRSQIMQRYRELSLKAGDARLVVWPEVTIPALEEQVLPYISQIRRLARQRGQTLLLGVLNRTDSALYNAVLAVGADEGRYYKRHLVPYGEYFPVPDFLLPLLKGVNLDYSNFTHGPQAQPLIRVGEVGLGLTICFEDAFGYEIRKAIPEAGILVNMTNDAWFEDSSAPHQHLQIARMRAMEAGRPLIRAANTGISGLIAADGRMLERVPQFQVQTIRTQVQPRQGVTPYMRYGDLPLWIAAWLLVFVGLVAGIYKRRL